jgi:hypothetical protein
MARTDLAAISSTLKNSHEKSGLKANDDPSRWKERQLVYGRLRGRAVDEHILPHVFSVKNIL